MKPLLSVCALGAISALVGCDPGLDDDKKLTEIDDDDAEELCRSEEKLSKQALGEERDYCMLDAAAQSDLTSCEAELASCIAGDGYEDKRAENWHCGSASADDIVETLPVVCEITIGQYRACLRDLYQAQLDFASGSSCDDFASGHWPEVEESSACEIAENRCPGLFD
jgi:hypothetical protein